MRQATFYAGVQARNACMQLTLLYKHESLSLARRTAARAAPSAAHMGEHRLVPLAVAAASRRRLRCFRLLHWYAAWTVAFAIGSHDATLGRPVGHLTRPVLYKRATCVSIDKLRTGVVTKLFLRGISASAS